MRGPAGNEGAAEFGSTAEETAMVDAVTRVHGDLGQGGAPRILEGMMTTGFESGIPVDIVTSYNWGSRRTTPGWCTITLRARR